MRSRRQQVQNILAIVLCLWVTIPSPAPGQTIECEYEDLLWSIDVGSQSQLDIVGYGIDIADGWLFATHANGLSIIDVADPGNPALIATHGNTPQYNYLAIDADGPILYVATSSPNKGVAMLDYANPLSPVLLDQHEIGFNNRDLQVVGNTLCVTDSSHTLNVFDISDVPSGLISRGSLLLDTVFSANHQLSHDGQIVFVTNSRGFDCVDISDPDSPMVIGSYFSGIPPATIDFANGVVFLAMSGKIETVDVSDPTHPLRMAELADDLSPTHGKAGPGSFSVAEYQGGVVTYDVSDPYNPQRLGARRPTTETRRVATSGDVCFAVSNRRITAIDVSGPRLASRLAKLSFSDQPFSASITLKTSDNYLFVLDLPNFVFTRFDNIGVVDLTDPSAPVNLGVYELPLNSHSFAANSSVVYLSTSNKGFFAIDIADPAGPVTLGQYDTGAAIENNLLEMLYEDGFVYAHSYNDFAVLDVSDLSQIALFPITNVSPYPITGMAKEGHLVYLIDERRRLIIVDVFNPTNPQVLWINDYPTPYVDNHPLSVSVSDGLLVFTNDSSPYQFVDVSNPFLPVWYPPVAPQTHAARCILSGGRAYLYDEFLGLEIYDVTSMPNLVRIGVSSGRSNSHGLALLRDDICVVGGGIFGYDIIRIGSDCSTPCPPDTNHDGTLSPADFTAWIAAFNAQAPECDQNGDGSCTPADFTAWIANYNAGC